MPQQADTGPVEVGYFQYMAIFNGISFHFFPETAHHSPNRNLEGIIWTPPASSRPYLDTSGKLASLFGHPHRLPSTFGERNGHSGGRKVLHRELLVSWYVGQSDPSHSPPPGVWLFRRIR